MMPTASGNVVTAGQGGGAVVQVQVINNHPTAQVTAGTDETGRTAQIVISEAANQIRENSGPVWSALRGATNVKSRMS